MFFAIFTFLLEDFFPPWSLLANAVLCDARLSNASGRPYGRCDSQLQPENLRRRFLCSENRRVFFSFSYRSISALLFSEVTARRSYLLFPPGAITSEHARLFLLRGALSQHLLTRLTFHSVPCPDLSLNDNFREHKRRSIIYYPTTLLSPHLESMRNHASNE